MADAYIVANIGCVFLVRAMNTGTILHIHFVAHSYIVHIATDNGVEPDAALVAHLNITGNGGIGSDETIGPEGGEDVVDWENE